MCSSCGCGIPEEMHNDPRNILFSQLTAAAEAQGIAVNDVVNNMHAMAHESHKVDLKPQPEPIKDAKTKLLTKDWAEWDAERAAESMGMPKAFAKTVDRMHHTLLQHGFKYKGPHQGVGTVTHRYEHPEGLHATHVRGQTQLFSPTIGNHVVGKPEDVQTFLKDHKKGPGAPSKLDLARFGDKRNKVLRKAVRALGDEIEEVIKGQRRDETGQFHPGKDNVHSHKMGTEIVTHSHDGNPKHTHPTRKYGPSFNHQ